MKSEIMLSLSELNTYYHNKLITCQGIIAELSPEFNDVMFGQIQIALIQCLKSNNQKTGIQWGIDVILQEDDIGVVNLGDKVQITGVLEVYKAHDCRPQNLAILTEKLEIINNEWYDKITERDVKNIEAIAKYPHLHENLANFIFDEVMIDDYIKLVGLLTIFSTDSPTLMEHGIHGKISVLIIGTSGTYKSTYLRKLKDKLSFMTINFSQKSDVRFVSNTSRYKIGGERWQISGLAEFAKDGIILIDNLEELKNSKLYNLDARFTDILKKSSILAAVHSKDNRYNFKMSAYENLQFSRKNSLLSEFDLILVTNSKLKKQIIDFEDKINKDLEEEDNSFHISNEFLRNFIIYAKKEYEPMILDEEVRDHIIMFKEEVIRLNNEKSKFNKINSGNLIRGIMTFSKAYARIALRKEIRLKDVKKVLQIFRNSLLNLDLI